MALIQEMAPTGREPPKWVIAAVEKQNEITVNNMNFNSEGSFLEDDDSTTAAMEGHQNVDGNSNLGAKDLILTTEDDNSDTYVGCVNQDNNMNDEDGSSCVSGSRDANFDNHSLKRK
ncbi:hypothetical protein PIB30_057692 [Stylosanthes scabra]|uniref:Uncharacterized protein n=1 Tax=Stylosanthes scabra TaxID=79078 RepID=A0ABU6UIH5_9FABA|nr:hypothetical protein [Stylosanthes scabra]